jgi:hypothetical protein
VKKLGGPSPRAGRQPAEVLLVGADLHRVARRRRTPEYGNRGTRKLSRCSTRSTGVDFTAGKMGRGSEMGGGRGKGRESQRFQRNAVFYPLVNLQDGGPSLAGTWVQKGSLLFASSSFWNLNS